MTEVEYLRRELLDARTLLARCVGNIEADNACMRIMHGVEPIDITERLLAEIREFQRHGVHVLPEGVERA